MRWQVSLGRVMSRGTFGYCICDRKNGKKNQKNTPTKFSKEKALGCVNSTMEHAGSRKLETLLLSPFLYDIYLQLADESAPDLRERSLDILEVGGGRHEVRHLDAVCVLWPLVHGDDEGGDAHAETDELHLVLAGLLLHQILQEGSTEMD